MRVARGLLGAVGVVLLGVGALDLLLGVPPLQLLGVGLWLAGAIVVHDGLLVPLLQALGVGVDRATRVLEHPARLAVRTGLGVGAVLTVVVVPAILARAQGARNATVLQVDYAQALGVAWLVIAVLTAVAATVLTVRARRRTATPPASGAPS